MEVMLSKAQLKYLKLPFDASADGGFAQDDYCFCAASKHVLIFIQLKLLVLQSLLR